MADRIDQDLVDKLRGDVEAMASSKRKTFRYIHEQKSKGGPIMVKELRTVGDVASDISRLIKLYLRTQP